jgi:hypothetical protein
LASGPEIAQLLARIADLDASFRPEDCDARAKLVCEITEYCGQSPLAASTFLPGLQQLMARTAALREHVVEQRLELSRSMDTLETQLRQLRSFGEPAAADATLLNRLA